MDNNITLGENWDYYHTYLTDLSIGEEILDFAKDNDLCYWETEENLSSRNTALENVFIRLYTGTDKFTLEEAEERLLAHTYGVCEVKGSNYGYSEYTVLGFDINTLKFGGHDLNQILESHKGEYYYLILSVQ